jgi:REP element-mobilizing transposase RayT
MLFLFYHFFSSVRRKKYPLKEKKMRPPRLIINENQFGIYHLISRVVDSSFRLNDIEKTTFEKIIKKQAVFCGITILTYIVMGNHFHILVRVPPLNEEIGLKTLIYRYRTLYGVEKTLELITKWKIWKKKKMHKEIADEQEAIKRRMHNISFFMKEVKQKFSKYYNKQHLRKGTLWEERFKSVIVEDTKESLTISSIYTDLNSVRAGITKDPRDYQWSGIAKAYSGNQTALEGITYIMKTEDVSQALQEYCALVARRGMIKKEGKASLSATTYKSMIAYSKIDYGDLSDYSIGAITKGCFIGSPNFVNEIFLKYKKYFGPKRKSGARRIPCRIGDIQLYSLRKLKKAPIVAVKESR